MSHEAVVKLSPKAWELSESSRRRFAFDDLLERKAAELPADWLAQLTAMIPAVYRPKFRLAANNIPTQSEFNRYAKVLYFVLSGKLDAEMPLSDELKASLTASLAFPGEIDFCIRGYLSRLKLLAESFNHPQNLEDLLYVVRYRLVGVGAQQYSIGSTQSSHTYPRVYRVAAEAGYGVVTSAESLTETQRSEIMVYLEGLIAAQYKPERIAQALILVIKAELESVGYRGEIAGEGYSDKAIGDIHLSVCTLLDIPPDSLTRQALMAFVEREDEDGLQIWPVTDVNWECVEELIERALFKQGFYEFHELASIPPEAFKAFLQFHFGAVTDCSDLSTVDMKTLCLGITRNPDLCDQIQESSAQFLVSITSFLITNAHAFSDLEVLEPFLKRFDEHALANIFGNLDPSPLHYLFDDTDPERQAVSKALLDQINHPYVRADYLKNHLPTVMTEATLIEAFRSGCLDELCHSKQERQAVLGLAWTFIEDASDEASVAIFQEILRRYKGRCEDLIEVVVSQENPDLKAAFWRVLSENYPAAIEAYLKDFFVQIASPYFQGVVLELIEIDRTIRAGESSLLSQVLLLIQKGWSELADDFSGDQVRDGVVAFIHQIEQSMGKGHLLLTDEMRALDPGFCQALLACWIKGEHPFPFARFLADDWGREQLLSLYDSFDSERKRELILSVYSQIDPADFPQSLPLRLFLDSLSSRVAEDADLIRVFLRHFDHETPSADVLFLFLNLSRWVPTQLEWDQIDAMRGQLALPLSGLFSLISMDGVDSIARGVLQKYIKAIGHLDFDGTSWDVFRTALVEFGQIRSHELFATFFVSTEFKFNSNRGGSISSLWDFMLDEMNTVPDRGELIQLREKLKNAVNLMSVRPQSLVAQACIHRIQARVGAFHVETLETAALIGFMFEKTQVEFGGANIALLYQLILQFDAHCPLELQQAAVKHHRALMEHHCWVLEGEKAGSYAFWWDPTGDMRLARAFRPDEPLAAEVTDARLQLLIDCSRRGYEASPLSLVETDGTDFETYQGAPLR